MYQEQGRPSVVWPIVFWISFLTIQLVAQQASPISLGAQKEVLQATDHPDVVAAFIHSPGWKKFTAEYGDGWTVYVDKRNMRPALVSGRGVRWIAPGEKVGLDDLDQKAQDFIREHPGLFELEAENLVLNRQTSSNLGERGQLWYLNYDYLHEGVPILGARVAFRISYGRLVQFGLEKVSKLDITPIPTLTKEVALANAVRATGDALGADNQILENGTLYFLPLAAEGDAGAGSPRYFGPAGAGYTHRLIYQFKFRLPGDFRNLVAQVDTHTGEILDLYDDTKYAQVSGGVYSRTVEEQEEMVVPFPRTFVSNNGNKVTDLGGFYPYQAGETSIDLQGAFFRISDQCVSPYLAARQAPGDLPLGTNPGTDCSTNPASRSTKAARNVFYHLNLTRLLAMKYLTGHPRASRWFNSIVEANVNLPGTCSAFWNGSANFLKSGGGCNNTGEIVDPILHEWGHGLDENTNGLQGERGKGEAVADLNAMFTTRDRCIGPGFQQRPVATESLSRCSLKACPTARRDLGCFVKRSDAAFWCPEGDAHCVGHVLSGAVYDLSNWLADRYGENEGWRVAERLFYLALPNIAIYVPGQTGNAYDAFVLAADDNGNLEDGVPDGDLIFAAFDGHEIAGLEYADHRVCASPPATPLVNAAPGSNQAILSWNMIPGAESYEIVRRLPGTQAFLPLASGIRETSYTDTQAANGIAYDYIVIAIAGPCSSLYGDHVTAVPGPGSI